MKPYFEGWYFKHQKDGNTVAFIPGRNTDENGICHTFLQIITNDDSYYIDYGSSPLILEIHKNSCPSIRLGNSYFSKNGIEIDVQTDNVSIKGLITYGVLSHIKYDIMGPFKHMPFMQCRHGIISMGHKLYGYINVNGKIIDFKGGIGYIETDRGDSFPSGYLWTQSNSFFNNSRIDISAATAVVPLKNIKFKGCICIINYNKKEYRLATYLGCKILDFNKNNLTIKQGKYKFEVHLIKGNFYELYAPDKGCMNKSVYESVNSRVQYKFYVKNELLFDICEDHACFEYV